MVWYVYCLCCYGRTLHLSCSRASRMLDVHEVKYVPCVYVQNDVCSSLCSCIFHRFPYRIYLCSIWIGKYTIISQRTNSHISDAQCSQKSQIKSDSKFLNHWKKPWADDFQITLKLQVFLSEDTPSTSSLPKGTSSKVTFDSSITQASDGCGFFGGAGVMSTPLLAWIWGDSNG